MPSLYIWGLLSKWSLGNSYKLCFFVSFCLQLYHIVCILETYAISSPIFI